MGPPADTIAPLRRAAARPFVALDAAVVRAHQTGVWRYLRFLGCAADVADDLTQEVFLVLLRSEVEDRGPAALDRWLRGVAHNLFRARRRALRRELAALTPERVEALWSSYAGDDAGDGYHDALRACLGRLDPRSREALALRFRDDRSRAEIARKLGVTDEGAKTLLRRAKARLRACIERRLPHERD